MFKRLKGKDLRRVVALTRFPDDPVARRNFEENTEPLHLSSALWFERHPEAANLGLITVREFLVLLREDRRADVLDRLERMEGHYAEVARLSAQEVERRIAEAGRDDPGIAPLRQVLVNGEDPRRAIAQNILRQIPIARRHVERAEEALELVEIEKLNAAANNMLIAPHAQRALQILAGERQKGASADDRRRADKVLWIEGPNDVPVFKAWLSKCPETREQVVAIVPLAGHQSASRHFDARQLLATNPNCFVILDSERRAAGGKPDSTRLKAANKLKQSGVPHLLTERRCIENYFSTKAVAAVYERVPHKIDPFCKLAEQVCGFSKDDNGAIANEMEWADIANTDIGKALAAFLR